MSLMSIDFRGISSQPAAPPVPVFHGSIDNSSAPAQQPHFFAYYITFFHIMVIFFIYNKRKLSLEKKDFGLVVSSNL